MSRLLAAAGRSAAPVALMRAARLARATLPGLAFAGSIGAAAFALHQLPALTTVSPMVMAIGVAILLNTAAGTPRWAAPGIAFALRRLLRGAIVLLGLQVGLAEIAAIGVTGLVVVSVSLVASLCFTLWLGRLLRVERRLTALIAAGTAICGASAVVAANDAVRGREEDVAYAIASITLFGTLAMFVYPLVYPALAWRLGLDAQGFGLWAGASIHEVAQVAGAAFQASQAAGEHATVAKLARIMLLLPTVLALGWLLGRTGGAAAGGDANPAAPFPWFVVGFGAMVAVNSAMPLSPATQAWAAHASAAMLTVALAAMGLATGFGRLRARGIRPLALAAMASLFIAALSLTMITLTR